MDPKDARVLQEAEGFLELDLPGPALAVLDRLAAPARATFEANLLFGEAHRALEQHSAAVPFFVKARDLRPAELAVYVSLGWCYKRIGQLPAAIEILVEAEQIGAGRSDAGSHALVMYNLSCYYALFGKKEEMLHWLGRALEKEEEFARLIPGESDFDAFRDDPDFRALTER